MYRVDDKLKGIHPGTSFGVMVVENFVPDMAKEPVFQERQQKLLEELHRKHTGYDRKVFAATEPACHYVRYFKKFKKTYPVLLQLESVLEGRPLPDAPPLVQAMFLTELIDSLLIAGHDWDRVSGKLTFGVSEGGEQYTGARGDTIELKKKDITLADEEDLILSVIYGQDLRTRITPETRSALYIVDGVPGLTEEEALAGLRHILELLRIYQPDIQPSVMEAFSV